MVRAALSMKPVAMAQAGFSVNRKAGFLVDTYRMEESP
jgi:hypothetical protein